MIVSVADREGRCINVDFETTIAKNLFCLSSQFPNEKIVWCHESCKEYLDVGIVDNLFHHKKMRLSYNSDDVSYFGNSVGYVERSPFININRRVTYPTWQMSSNVGVISASALNLLQGKIYPGADFDYFLCSVAKLCM